MNFYAFKTCNCIFSFLKKSQEEYQCLEENFLEIVPNSTNASDLKHIPILEKKENFIQVKVGEETHPMLQQHYIEWIVLETDKGYQVRKLKPNDEAVAKFFISKDDVVIAAYAYCNLHQLWKKSMESKNGWRN